jgi:hypothetical protein
VALGLQPFTVGELGRTQIGMFTQRVRGGAARWIFAGCGAAGRGILKGQGK